MYFRMVLYSIYYACLFGWLLKPVDDVSHFPSTETYFPAVFVGVTAAEVMEGGTISML